MDRLPLDASGDNVFAPLIEVRKVSFAYTDSSRDIRVLNDVSFSVNQGSTLAILGPSGCGKTTLLRLIGGLLGENEDGKGRRTGEIQIDSSKPSIARDCGDFGFVFQDPILLPWRSVERNVSLPVEFRASRRGRRNERGPEEIQELIDLVGLGGFESAYPRQLSAGMQQRAAIARALLNKPRILLMDEPFASVDEMRREDLHLDLKRIQRQTGATIILVTHDIYESVVLADQVLILTDRPASILALLDVNVSAAETGSQAVQVTRYVEEIRTILRRKLAP